MIEFDVADRVGRIVINRPDAGNAFTTPMIERLAGVLADAARETEILVIAGTGADFTLGRDRNEPHSGGPFESFSRIDAVNRALAAYPGISIAAVKGRAFGFGVGLAMRCDLAVGEAGARFCLDEVKLGFPPMFIMEEILQHLRPKRAADIVLLSREFGAEEALDAGLLSRVVTPAEFEATISEMIGDLGARDAEALRACKRYMKAVREIPAEARPAYALIEQTRFALGSH